MTNNSIIKWLAAAGGAVVSFFTGLPPLVWILVGVMTLDMVTGLICGATGKSPKTETGKLSSKAAFEGLMKKVMVLLVVLLAALIDLAVTSGAGISFNATVGAVCLWFIASEGVSVLENAAQLGLPIPRVLTQALDIMASKGAGEETQERGDATKV